MPFMAIYFQALVLSLTIPCLMANAQNTPSEHKIHFERFTNQDGLSSPGVTALLQDRSGFLWIGTQKGLNRYDGKEFRELDTFVSEDSDVVDAFIITLTEDKEGIIWIGTRTGDLYAFDPVTNQLHSYTDALNGPSSADASKAIRAIYEDSSGSMWIASEGRGLFRAKPASNVFELIRFRMDISQPLNIYSITESLSTPGLIWLGTSRGLYSLDSSTSLDSNVFDLTRVIDHDYPFNIKTILENPNGVLWLGTGDRGLLQYNINTKKLVIYDQALANSSGLSDNEITSLVMGPDEVIWIGTRNGGLNFFSTAEQQFTHYTTDQISSSNTVNIIFRDRSGVMWMGSMVGLNKYAPAKIRFETHKFDPEQQNGLQNPDIHSIHEDQFGMIWLGGNGALIRYNPQNQTYRHFTDPSGKFQMRIFAIMEDEEGNLWLGGGTSAPFLFKFDRDIHTFEPINFEEYLDTPSASQEYIIHSIYESKREPGVLWIGTSQKGLFKFNVQEEKVIHYKASPEDPDGLSHNYVWTIYEDRKGFLWLGTLGGGLLRFDQSTETFTRFEPKEGDPTSISSDQVISIAEDKNGSLWVGTFDNGLNVLNDSTSTFKRYTKKSHGLPDNGIGNILPDESGNLWLTTNNGLSKFNVESKVFTNYDTRDGLHGDFFYHGAGFRSKNGELYFGGRDGFSILKQNGGFHNSFDAEVVLTDFLLFYDSDSYVSESLDTSITYATHVTLPTEKNSISFEFAALRIHGATENSILIQTGQALDDGWVNSNGKNNSVTYAGLSPGEVFLQC